MTETREAALEKEPARYGRRNSCRRPGHALRPHTLETPKPLLPVRGRPILDWSLGSLPPAVDRVVVVVNYLAEQIEAYLGRQKHIKEWAVVRQAQPAVPATPCEAAANRFGRLRS